MKYDIMELLKIFVKTLIDPRSISNDFRKNSTLKYPWNLKLNNINNITYIESESNNEKYYENVPMDNNEDYNDNDDNSNIKNSDYYDKKLDTSSNSQSIIDSIAQELTPVKLQQAIILSEIIGKPKSMTKRKRRRF